MSKLKLDLTAVQATGTDTPIVSEVEDEREWKEGPDGKRRPGERIGTRYTVVMQNNGCAPMSVRTPEAVPAISAEEVAAACLSGHFIRVRFENFRATPYQGKSGLGISATADKCVVVPPTSGNK